MAHGCYNRKPFVEGEWLHGRDSRTGCNITIYLKNTGSRECQYQKNDRYGDKECVGCIHKEVKNDELPSNK